MKIFKDFAQFINKGNVVDMAVGVVVGGAFGKIVTSLVADIITPCITYFTSSVGKNAGKAVLRAAQTVDGAEIAEVAINYGSFIQTIIDFLIIAFCIFLVVKLVAKLREANKAVSEKITKKSKEESTIPTPAPKPSAEEKLLTEIRDLLKKDKDR